VLKVKHIIVCGHYGCGGVSTVVHDKRAGLVDNWLQHIKDIYFRYQDRFDVCVDQEERVDVLCEINVVEQVLNLTRTTMVQEAWARGEDLSLHGLIYSIRDGILRDLGVSYDSKENLPDPMHNPIMASSR